MKILINGICGHMGREVLALCEAGYRGAECVGGVDPFAKGNETYCVYKSFSDVPAAEIDCIVDFSHHTVTAELLYVGYTAAIQGLAMTALQTFADGVGRCACCQSCQFQQSVCRHG